MKLLEIWDSKIFRSQVGQVEDPYTRGSKFWDDPTKQQSSSSQPVVLTVDKQSYSKLYPVWEWEQDLILDETTINTDIDDVPTGNTFMIVNYEQGARPSIGLPGRDIYFEKDGAIFSYDESGGYLYQYAPTIQKQHIVDKWTNALR